MADNRNQPIVGAEPPAPAAGEEKKLSAAEEAKRQAQIEASERDRRAFAGYFSAKYRIPKWLNVSELEPARVAGATEDVSILKVFAPNSDLLKDGIYRNAKHPDIDFVLRNGAITTIPPPTDFASFSRSMAGAMDLIGSGLGNKVVYVGFGPGSIVSEERIREVLRLAEARGQEVQFHGTAYKQFIESNRHNWATEQTPKGVGLDLDPVAGQTRRDNLLLLINNVNAKSRHRLRQEHSDILETNNIKHLKSKMDSTEKLAAGAGNLDDAKNKLVEDVLKTGADALQGEARFDAMSAQVNNLDDRVQRLHTTIQELSSGIDRRNELLDGIKKNTDPLAAAIVSGDEDKIKQVANQVAPALPKDKSHLEKMETSLKSLNTNLTSVSESLDKEREDIKTKLDVWTQQLHEYRQDQENKPARTEEDKKKDETIDQLEGKIGTLKQDLTKIQEDAGKLKPAMQTLETTFKDTKASFDKNIQDLGVTFPAKRPRL